MFCQITFLSFLLSVMVFPASLFADSLARIEVHPQQISLQSARDRVQLVITAISKNGATQDITHDVSFRLLNPAIAKIENSVVLPRSNGKTDVSIQFGQLEAILPVTVSDQSEPDPVRFQNETLAILTKQGCNAGSCHGSPQGKGGFSLSLFAYDSQIDKKALVREGFNRRTNIYDPDESLMLKKPLLRIPHVGGKRLRKADITYQILHQWIYEGAGDDPENAPRCTSIAVYPQPERILRMPHVQQQMRVLANFDDGSQRDITHLATFDTSHDEIATVDAMGQVTGTAQGQSAITVRYLEFLESVYFTVVDARKDSAWPDIPENNYVDQFVNQRLQLLKILPATTCADTIFLRRTFLDLTGLLPTAERAREFLKNTEKDKREVLIDQLLASDEFAHFQALRLADLLRINAEVMTDGRAKLFADWIALAVKSNMPFDDFARKIITARGDSHTVPATNYFMALPQTTDIAEATSQIFMGSRIQCAKCHNHPFENWTQNDYYSISAVFSRIQRSETKITISPEGDLQHPHTGQVMKPWGSETSASTTDKEPAEVDPRADFASWLTAHDNPYFARVEVNRIWKSLFGQGIVEPVDDFRSSNPPSNVALLDALADDFVQNDYDRKHIFRVVCNSQTYQRSTISAREITAVNTLFSHANVRLLTAEQLSDAIGYVTETLRPASEIPQWVDQMQGELAAVKAELQDQQLTWEETLHTRMQQAAYWHGGWWSTRPFIATDQSAAHHDIFPPEEQLDGQPADLPWDDGEMWSFEKDWEPGQTHTYEEKRPAAVYAYHPIFANRKATLRLSFVADDGMKFWHDGQVVYDRMQITDDGQNSRDIELHPGLNHLFFKASNGGGAFHFTVKMDYVKATEAAAPQLVDIAGHAAAILHTPRPQRSEIQFQLLKEYHFAVDGRIPALRKRLNLGGRFDYATQRPYPEQTDFLKAFGQPKRASACVCERVGDPTLEQALQMLNGTVMTDKVNRSVKRYLKLDDQKVVEELYLAAFSRFPQPVERNSATAHLSRSGKPREASIRDLVWAIMNTQEFMFQH